MQSKSTITLLAVCLLTLFDLNQAQCTTSTTTCSECDDDPSTCGTNTNCRVLLTNDINQNLPAATQICVNLGTCDSDCTVCPDTAAGCSDAGGSRANCIIAGAGDNAGTCVGFTCALSCEQCGIQADCESAEAEPNGCLWDTSGAQEECVLAPTPMPTTVGPTTESPTTAAPTTAAPTTASPTTASPTTASPTTASPTTASPTTAAPTTVGPTSEGEDPATTTWWTHEPTTAGGGSSSSGSSSSSWSWSKSSSSSSGWSSSSEVVVDDDTTARTAWTARIAANRNSEKVWRSVPDLQSTNSDDEQEAAGEANANQNETAADKVEWSVGKATMINLWAMLIVCLFGNAVICCIANRKKQENAHFHHDEHETGI